MNCATSSRASYESFSPDNDPYGEHDFGSFQLDSLTLFWKIDFDNAFDHGSPDSDRPGRNQARPHHLVGRGILARPDTTRLRACCRRRDGRQPTIPLHAPEIAAHSDR